MIPSLNTRLALLGFVAVLVQLALVGQLTVFGATTDLLPLVVASVGLMCGSLPGAVLGFGIGFFVDAALLQTMGLSSLCYLTAGYGAGRLRELRDPQGAGVPVMVGAVATAVATGGFSVMRFLLGQTTPVSFLLVGQLVIAVGVNALLAGPVYAGVRRWLDPVLPDDPRRRRRRAYTTGGLSPLSRA